MGSAKNRACSECHAAKVKCVKIITADGSESCERCERLGLLYVEHVSRQGQGTRRRRKKVKTKDGDPFPSQTHSQQPQQTRCLSPVITPCCPTSSGVPVSPSSGQGGIVAAANSLNMLSSLPVITTSNGARAISNCTNSINNNNNNRALCSGMEELQIEDRVVQETLSNGIGKDHYGMHCLIRHWVALSFSRRSFSLLARASFIASKLGISMDDILSNESPFAGMTDSQPMDFLARDMLLPKGQRKTLGYPLHIGEVPWDVLRAVKIDPHRLDESVRNRWICVRWTAQGTTRYWTSQLFARDFASVDEMHRVYAENRGDRAVVDLWIPKSEKAKIGQGVFNHVFLHKRPNMPCFVTKTRYGVYKRCSSEIIPVDVITTCKLLDLDSFIHYHEIQFIRGQDIQHQSQDHRHANHALFRDVTMSSQNKRGMSEMMAEAERSNNNDEPIMDDIEFTNMNMTEEMEEFLKILGGQQDEKNAGASPVSTTASVFS